MTLERRTPLKRTGIKRGTKGLARVGAKTKREAPAWAACKRLVRKRSGGCCEAPGTIRLHVPDHNDAEDLVRNICGTTRRHAAADPHHVWPEDHDRGVHDPHRVLDVCRSAHDWTHAHPALAAIVGLLRPEDDQCLP